MLTLNYVYILAWHENVFQYLKDPTDASLSCLKGSDVREDVLRKGLSHKPNQWEERFWLDLMKY